MAFPSCVDRAIEYILTNYRWVFVCFFLLPASLLYDIYNYGRKWIIVKLNSAPKLHHRKVKNVQKQVSKNSAQWYAVVWTPGGRKTSYLPPPRWIFGK
jgi:delta24-sterol reductase